MLYSLGSSFFSLLSIMIILEQGGLLSRNPETGRYRLGVDLIGIAAQLVSHMDVRKVARPFL
jgi:IclR family acetate operon transcriptional repressor